MFNLREELWQGRRWGRKTILMFAVALLAGSEPVPLAQSPSPDYPQWRGRNRDGAASGFSEPKSWPENLNRRWKVVVGEGDATPIVIGNTVYSFTRREGNEVVSDIHQRCYFDNSADVELKYSTEECANQT